MTQINYLKCKCNTRDGKFKRGNLYATVPTDNGRTRIYEPNTKQWIVFQSGRPGKFRTNEPSINAYFDRIIYRREFVANKKELNSFIKDNF